MSVTLSRRELLKTGAAATAGLTFLRFAGPEAAPAQAAPAGNTEGSLQWKPTICNMCPNICGIKVGVKMVGGKERAVKIEGNPAHPYNQGRICARGQAGLRRQYSPDRLKTPLIRVEGSKRGEWAFRKATWDEAYDLIMKKVKEHNIQPYEMAILGAWNICLFYKAHRMVLAKVLQTPNIVSFQVQNCMLGQHFGLDSVVGSFNAHDDIVSDYANAKLILSLRSNASLTSASGRTRRFTDGLRNGAKVILLDPRMSEAAAKADVWLPVRPGTDQAVLLVILREMINRKTYDADFLTNYSNAPYLAMAAPKGPMVQMAMKPNEKTGKPGQFFVFDENSQSIVALPAPMNGNFKDINGNPVKPALIAPDGLTMDGKPVKTAFQFLAEKVQPYTAEWATDICDIPADTIAAVAEEFATTPGAMVDSGWYDSRFENSIQTWRTASLIQILTGGIDRPGGWYYNASTRELNKSFWDTMRAGEQPKMAPGMYMGFGMSNLFGNAENWSHGVPNVARVWSDQQWEAGNDGAAFTMVHYNGYPESMKGELSYNGKPYQLKFLLLTATNPVRSAYSDTVWKEALSSPKVPLIVAYDLLPQDTLLYADIILPDFSYLERGDQLYHAEQSLEAAYVARNPIEPIVDGRHMLDVFFELADRFGRLDPYIKGMAGLFGWDAEALGKTVKKARADGVPVGTPIRDMLINGMAKKKGVPVEKLQQIFTEQGVLPTASLDELLEEAGIPYKYPAPTLSGRIELYSIFFAGYTKKYGYKPNWDPLVAYMDPGWRPELSPKDSLADDECYFMHGHIPTMSHTSTANNDLLMAMTEQQGLLYTGIWINPQKAGKLGLKTGDAIALENTNTGQKATGTAFVTELIRPDTVFMASALGHENDQLSTAKG
ncbi:MAG: polysulfide reductase, partial [Chloroflexi bacterium]